MRAKSDFTLEKREMEFVPCSYSFETKYSKEGYSGTRPGGGLTDRALRSPGCHYQS